MKATSGIGDRLVDWYSAHGRDLPWRRRPDPYRVWISEVMLQQTTVAVAGAYFSRFVRRYPDVQSLARAREEDVLVLWSGLGYYHRARNLRKAARVIRDSHGGRIPRDPAALRALPGVGPYTAGAILSIGYNLPHAALDGNIMRVISRLGAIEADPGKAGTRRDVESLVLELMPAGDASAFNQALMDLGATICSPRHPDCGRCPVASGCLARLRGTVDRIPPARAVPEPVGVEMTAMVVRRAGACLLVQRGDGPLMGGLWEFPLAHVSDGSTVEDFARSLDAEVSGRMGRVRHAITRHRINITVYEGRPVGGRRRAARGRRARAMSPVPRLSEAGARLATPLGDLGGKGGRTDVKTRWVPIRQLAGDDGLALAGAARKIARLISGSPSPAAPRRERAEAAR